MKQSIVYTHPSTYDDHNRIEMSQQTSHRRNNLLCCMTSFRHSKRDQFLK